MNIKLDRYLTEPPDDNDCTEWVEAIINSLSDDFYNKHEKDITICDRNWFNDEIDLQIKTNCDLSPKEVAKIIEDKYKNK